MVYNSPFVEDRTGMKKSNPRIILIGALIGAVTGALAAVILMQRSEEAQHPPKITAGDGVKVGLGVLNVLKLISDLGSRR